LRFLQFPVLFLRPTSLLAFSRRIWAITQAFSFSALFWWELEQARCSVWVFPTLLKMWQPTPCQFTLASNFGKKICLRKNGCEFDKLKRELSNTLKLSVFKPVFVPILIYVHEAWVMTEKLLSQVAAETGCLRRVHAVTLSDKVRSCEIRRALNVENHFSESRDTSYVGAAMRPECPRKTVEASPAG